MKRSDIKPWARDLAGRIARRVGPSDSSASTATYHVADTRMGPMVVRSDDAVIGVFLTATGDFQTSEVTDAVAHIQRTTDLLDELECFVDVGANIGTHTLHSLQGLGFARAICVEPNGENHRILKANLALNGVDGRASVVRAACSDRNGTAVLRLSPTNRGDHRVEATSSANLHNESTWESETIDVIRLESVLGGCDPNRTLVWIDTQGHECSVLSGLATDLRNTLPIAFEFWPYGLRECGRTVSDLKRFLSQHTLWDLASTPYVLLDWKQLESMYDRWLTAESSAGSAHTMLLAIPKQSD